VGRGQHKLAFTASNLIAETRILLQDLFHCPTKRWCLYPYSDRGTIYYFTGFNLLVIIIIFIYRLLNTTP
jgi:hypothetical protein